MKPIDVPARNPLIAISLLVVHLVLMSLHAHSQLSQQSMSRTVLLMVMYPLQKATFATTSKASNLWYEYINLRGARLENQRLHQENAKLQQEILSLYEEAQSNKRLQQILNLKQNIKSATIAAHVIAREPSPWFKQIVIDQGKSSGIQLNQIVLTPQGIVGRIVGVGLTSSVIQLITDGYAGVGVMLIDSRSNGELHGRNNSQCELDSISVLTPVREGEAVLTTGLDGIYPKGLLVGYVSQIQLGSGTALHQILVSPSASLDKLEEVIVLLNRPDELNIIDTVKKY